LGTAVLQRSRQSLTPAALLFLMFGALLLNPGYLSNLGGFYERKSMPEDLAIPRAGLRVTHDDADVYRRVMRLVREHRRGGQLIAMPDCPEIYFLSGELSPAGDVFDFLSQESFRRSRASLADADVIVVNHRPGFSPRLSDATMRALRSTYSNGAVVANFEVRWRHD
jgi:hypothetical protein